MGQKCFIIDFFFLFKFCPLRNNCRHSRKTAQERRAKARQRCLQLTTRQMDRYVFIPEEIQKSSERSLLIVHGHTFQNIIYPKHTKQTASATASGSVWRIHPLQFEFAVRQRHLLVKAVTVPQVIGDVHSDWAATQEHAHVPIIYIRGERGEDEGFILQRCFWGINEWVNGLGIAQHGLSATFWWQTYFIAFLKQLLNS